MSKAKIGTPKKTNILVSARADIADEPLKKYPAKGMAQKKLIIDIIQRMDNIIISAKPIRKMIGFPTRRKKPTNAEKILPKKDIPFLTAVRKNPVPPTLFFLKTLIQCQTIYGISLQFLLLLFWQCSQY